MKTFSVKTQSATNSMLLHSTMKEEFVTTDFAEAKAAFDKEVEQLSLEYKKSEQLNYSPTDDEMRHAIICTLVSIEDDEVEYLDESDYFFQE